MKTFKPKTVPFTIEDEESVRHYVIGNMSGDARDSFMESLGDYMTRTVDTEGNVKVTPKVDKVQAPHSILFFCVFPANKDGQRTSKKLVERDVITAFPVDVLDWAMVEAAKLNGFNKEGQDEAKKSSSDQSEEPGTESPSDSAVPSEKPSVV